MEWGCWWCGGSGTGARVVELMSASASRRVRHTSWWVCAALLLAAGALLAGQQLPCMLAIPACDVGDVAH